MVAFGEDQEFALNEVAKNEKKNDDEKTCKYGSCKEDQAKEENQVNTLSLLLQMHLLKY